MKPHHALILALALAPVLPAQAETLHHYFHVIGDEAAQVGHKIVKVGSDTGHAVVHAGKAVGHDVVSGAKQGYEASKRAVHKASS